MHGPVQVVPGWLALPLFAACLGLSRLLLLRLTLLEGLQPIRSASAPRKRQAGERMNFSNAGLYVENCQVYINIYLQQYVLIYIYV